MIGNFEDENSKNPVDILKDKNHVVVNVSSVVDL